MRESTKQIKDFRRKEGVMMNISELARLLNCSWTTAKKKINETSTKQRKHSSTILDDYKETIIEKRDKYLCSSKSIYLYIKELGYNGSYTTVKNFVKSHKETSIQKAVMRVLNGPGIQAQVDWKESFRINLKTGEVIVINIFLYILSYSKYKYIELTADRSQNTLFKCIINAFEYCNGIPSEIWFDNMRTVVDKHDIHNGEVIFNKNFTVFASDCGFKPIACRPYRPMTKGIIENVAKVMDRLKVYNDEFETLIEFENYIKKFNHDLNNELCQATNEIPKNMFSKEKEYLKPLVNNNILDTYKDAQVRKVSVDSLIIYKGYKYSVPISYIGKTVEIEEKENNLYIYYNKKYITHHTISEKTYNFHKEHLKEVIVSDIYKNANDEDIEKIVIKRLEEYDKYGRK